MKLRMVRAGLQAIALLSVSAAAERISYAEISSAALGRSLPVAIVAPTPRSAPGDPPVLYFLHGRGRNHRSLVESPVAREALLTAEFYVVLPQGEEQCIGLDIGSTTIKGAVLDLRQHELRGVVQRPFPQPLVGLPVGFFEVVWIIKLRIEKA